MSRMIMAAAAFLSASALTGLAHAQNTVVFAEAGVRFAPVANCAVFTSHPVGRPYHVESCLANVVTVHQLPEYRQRHVVVRDHHVLRPSRSTIVYVYK